MAAESFDPIVSEFASEDDARDYDSWFRAKVEASLADPRPTVPMMKPWPASVRRSRRRAKNPFPGDAADPLARDSVERPRRHYRLHRAIPSRRRRIHARPHRNMRHAPVGTSLLFRPSRVPGTRERVAHPNDIVVYRVLAEAVDIV